MLSFTGILGVLQAILIEFGFYWVFEGLVTSSFTEFYWVLPKSTALQVSFSTIFIGWYRFSTSFYRVLLGINSRARFRALLTWDQTISFRLLLDLPSFYLVLPSFSPFWRPDAASGGRQPGKTRSQKKKKREEEEEEEEEFEDEEEKDAAPRAIGAADGRVLSPRNSFRPFFFFFCFLFHPSVSAITRYEVNKKQKEKTR